MPDRISRDLKTTYPLADRLTRGELDRAGLASWREAYRTIRAVWTGEIRCPAAGEWYLSGGVVEAYRTVADLSQPYHIARLVKVKTRMRTIETVEAL